LPEFTNKAKCLCKTEIVIKKAKLIDMIVN
jgi:hypothetical protein